MKWRLLLGFLSFVVAAFSETISIDTSSLIGNLNAPFTFDFQFADGSGTGDGNNTVTLSDFDLSGGSLMLVPGSIAGGVTIASGPFGIDMTDSSFFNEVQFTIDPGASLSFNLTTTSNADVGTPDTFALALLDSNLNDLPTSNPANGFALVEYDFASTDPTGAAQLVLSGTVANSDGVTIPTPSVITNTPEPVGLVGILAAIPVLLRIRRFLIDRNSDSKRLAHR